VIGEKLNYKWNFRCVDPVEFEVVFNMVIPFDRIRGVVNKTIMAALKKLGEKGCEDDVLGGGGVYEVPDSMLNFVGVKVKKNMKMVVREVRSDGINVVRWRVDKALFLREWGFWRLTVFVGGEYVDERFS